MTKEFRDAEEYYRQTRMVETRNWSLQMALNFADEYHEAKLKLLGICGVVVQSEQLVCDCGNSDMTWYGNDDDKKWFCFNCKKEAN